jgi:hypothetical protein
MSVASNVYQVGELAPAETAADDRRESGQPGGGEGRIAEVGHSGVQPVSIPHAALADAVIRTTGEWGRGERSAAGYHDHGESGLIAMPPGREAPSTGHVTEEPPPTKPRPSEQAELKQQPARALPSGLIRDWRRPSE